MREHEPRSRARPLAGRLGRSGIAARCAVVGAAFCAASYVGSCSGGGGGGEPQSGLTGVEMAKPGGGGATFFVDENRAGSRSEIRVAELLWGRLVDVHDVDEDGRLNPEPIFRDLVVNENVQSDGSSYRLEASPITQKTRLVVLRTRVPGSPGAFESLLARATSGLSGVLPRHDDGSSPAPFSFVARNACLVIRFDDCMDDGPQAARDLSETVKVFAGYPPETPFNPRILFDPNHGAIVGGEFHSTRVLIDMTVSEAESVTMPVPQPINSLGLPASLPGASSRPNVSVRIPARLDFGTGQFALLRGLTGVPLATRNNGPVDATSPTFDVVRAMRAGNSKDLNNGFLLDLNAPEILGSWGATISNVRNDPPAPAGVPGFDFLVDVTFSSVCQDALEPGDIVSVGSSFLEVRRASSPPDQDVIRGLAVRLLADAPRLAPGGLAGVGLAQSTYDPASPVPLGCWMSFAPQAKVLPVTEVSPASQASVQFSEPMDPESLTPFGTFMVVRGDANTPVLSSNIVVGNVNPTPDSRGFFFSPLVPLAHVVGFDEAYHVRLDGPTDLAGNALANKLPPVDFGLDPKQPTQVNGGVVMRFSAIDELEPIGFDDLRGQIFYDLDEGLIRPRPVAFQSFPADRNNPVPAIMIPFPMGVQTPLTPLGSKMHAVWRYADLGWQVSDETKYNLDVSGLYWSPVGGRLLRDFYEEFEIRLSHSRWLPDESIDSFLLPRWPNSGLVEGPTPFDANVLNDGRSPQKIVHSRELGYLIDPLDLTSTTNGTPLAPWPLNRRGGGPLRTFTWRDTAALNQAAPAGKGIPMDIEVGAPLNLEPAPAGAIADAGFVPTFGLPLLMEFRCYPSDSGVGLNALDISLAVNSSVHPNFRSFSSGGTNRNGATVVKDPDLEIAPTGGFNPSSRPNPGAPTRYDADNTFYIGQLDTVTRVSRAHTIWIDSLFNSPSYLEPVFEPPLTSLPTGTAIVVEYRGATGFVGAGTDPFDSRRLDAYGNLRSGTAQFLTNQDDWRSRLAAFDGARYFQMRLSFLNNVDTGLSVELSGLGIAFIGS